MCSFYADFGTFDRGCSRAGLNLKNGEIRPYAPENLKNMLKVSYNSSLAENAMYNEILIDSKNYVRHLPGSIAAVVWFADESSSGMQFSANEQARMEATKAYIGILDTYNLTEAELPLIKIIRPERDQLTGKPTKKAMVVDKSLDARKYYSEHKLAIYRQHRPHSPILSNGSHFSDMEPQLKQALKSQRPGSAQALHLQAKNMAGNP